MRCRDCKVDLPDNYTACPLCGAKTHADAPSIPGIRYSECPKVKTAKYYPNPFPIFLGIWAVCAIVSIALLKTGILTAAPAYAIICGVAFAWTLIGRPLWVKQLYIGNFAVMNIWPMALGCALFGDLNAEVGGGFAMYAPVCCVIVLSVLFGIVLAQPTHAKRAAPYCVLFAAGSVAAVIAVAIKYGIFAPAWLFVVLAAGIILAFLLIKHRRATIDELKAKFSIQ